MPNIFVVTEKISIPFVMWSKLGNDTVFSSWCESKEEINLYAFIRKWK